MPIGANKILDQLSIEKNKRKYINFNDSLEVKIILPKPEGVFPRLNIRSQS